MNSRSADLLRDLYRQFRKRESFLDCFFQPIYTKYKCPHMLAANKMTMRWCATYVRDFEVLEECSLDFQWRKLNWFSQPPKHRIKEFWSREPSTNKTQSEYRIRKMYGW